jgi:putative ABC transport system permease protein
MIFGGTPCGGVNTRTALVSEGTPPEGKPVSFRRVTPDYFATLRIVLRRGRFFDDGDREGRPRVAIVNETAARSYFLDKNALGASIVLDKQPYTVVGVIADVQQNHFTNRVSAEAFVPAAFGAAPRGDILVHTAGDPMNALPAVRAAVRAELPGVPIRDVRTMDAMRSQQFAEFRLDTMLVSLFAVAGMTISAVGLYGLLTHIVAERSREIGVRMALGASRGSAIRLVVRQAGVLVLAGLALGTGGSRLLAKTMAAFVFHVDPGDLRALAVAVALLAVVALAAIVFPARRAASVEPLEALRMD